MAEYKYVVNPVGGEFDHVYSLTSVWDGDDLERLAEDAAEEYHDFHDGWESGWPLKIEMRTVDGEKIGVCEVDKETRPEFSATSI